MSVEAALTHQGMAMGRVSLIGNLLEAGQLVAPFKQVKSPTKYCLLYPKELADRPGTQAVIRWPSERCHAGTQWVPDR